MDGALSDSVERRLHNALRARQRFFTGFAEIQYHGTDVGSVEKLDILGHDLQTKSPKTLLQAFAVGLFEIRQPWLDVLVFIGSNNQRGYQAGETAVTDIGDQKGYRNLKRLFSRIMNVSDDAQPVKRATTRTHALNPRRFLNTADNIVARRA